MDAGWFNIGSLVLGLIAWIIPIINLVIGKKQINKKWIALTIFSFSACVIAICFQIFYNRYLVNMEDWSALPEMRAVAIASSVLAIITILLNALTLFLYRIAAYYKTIGHNYGIKNSVQLANIEQYCGAQSGKQSS